MLAEDGQTERLYWIVISEASTQDPQPSSGLNDMQLGGLPEFTFDEQETRYDLTAPVDLSEVTVMAQPHGSGFGGRGPRGALAERRALARFQRTLTLQTPDIRRCWRPTATRC